MRERDLGENPIFSIHKTVLIKISFIYESKMQVHLLYFL